MDALIDKNCKAASDPAPDVTKLPGNIDFQALCPQEATEIPGPYQFLCTMMSTTPWTGSAVKR